MTGLIVDLSYGYSNARTKALESKLLDKDRLRAIMDVPTLNEFIEMLEESPYKQALVNASVSRSGIDLVKRALDDNLTETFRKVVDFSPEKARPLLKLYLQYWQVNNLKKIIALKGIGSTAAASDLFIIDESDARFFAPFLASKNLAECIEAFMSTEYSLEIAKAKVDFESSGDFRTFLSALDYGYYKKLSQQVDVTKDAHLARFLRMRINVLNASTALRMRQSKVSSGQLRKYMIPAGSRQFVRLMLSALTTEEALSAAQKTLHVTFSAQAIEAAKQGSLGQVEVELEYLLLRQAQRTARLSVLSVGTMLAYLHLKQEEVHALRKIAFATVLDVKNEVRKTVYAAR